MPPRYRAIVGPRAFVSRIPLFARIRGTVLQRGSDQTKKRKRP